MTKKYVVRPETAVLTRGFDPHLAVGAARPAVFRSSTYVFSSPESAARAFDIALGRATRGEHESVDLIYARLSHPNAQILEDQTVPLERGATEAAAFNSGMAAISTVLLTFCQPGSTVVHTAPLYGGTELFLDSLLTSLGVTSVAVPAGDATALAAAIAAAKDLRVVFLETPANPTLRMTDIARAAEAARAHPDRPLVVVDNTFLGPTFQHPLPLGADLVVYSATKYLNGFSDLLAGMVLSADSDRMTQLRGTRAILGNILQPDECWLLNTRLPTVTLRMNKQSKSAQRIAEAVARHPALSRVLYPTLFDDPEQIRVRDAQCDYPGGIVTLDFAEGRAAAFAFLRHLRIFHNAVSLGGVESLACHPRTTTHSEMSPETLDAVGITEGMVRLSVGIESWHDLLADVQSALDAAG